MTMRTMVVIGCLIALSACGDQAPVAGNCDGTDCAAKKAQALSRDKLDILLVVDNSGSIAPKLELLKAELPRMLNAFVNGSDPDAGDFPPVQSVHLGVITSDMGLGQDNAELAASICEEDPESTACEPDPFADFLGCNGLGDNGVLVEYGQSDLSGCEKSYPGYLTFEGDAAAAATVDTVACLPVVGSDGCGFEQPLEAALKALWPASDSSTGFLSGGGHGEDSNVGFLRADSVLVVVVVSDEDDCSVSDPRAVIAEYEAINGAGEWHPMTTCVSADAMYSAERYVDGFKALRQVDEDVIFVAIGGIPGDLVDGPRSGETEDYFDEVLQDPRMTLEIRTRPIPSGGRTEEYLADSCNTDGTPVASDAPSAAGAKPPRRLVEVARGFGDNGVLGSLCNPDFGSEVGMIMATVAQRLRQGEVE